MSRLMKLVQRGDVAGMESALKKSELTAEDFVAIAITSDQPACLECLLKKCADTEALQKHIKEESGLPPLGTAVSFASPAVLRLLLENGMKPELEEESPWIRCCVDGKPEHARVLAEFGADAMSAQQRDDAKGISPVHAIVYGWFEHPEASLPMLNYLLERGEDVNAVSVSGNTPLDLAYDETHVGFRTIDSLRDILKKAGAVRGASLRVPHPMYTIRIFLNDTMPDTRAYLNTLPEGVRLKEHRSPWTGVSDLLDSYKELPEPLNNHLRSHSGWIEILAEGQPGEYPPTVMQRALTVARPLAGHYSVVAVQCGRYLGSSLSALEDASLNPLEMVHLEHAVSEDNYVVICTDGMVAYGLPEYEFSVPVSVCKRLNMNPVEPMYDVLVQAFNGTSCLEPGHTMTLMDCFTLVGWGETYLTQKQGFRIQMSGDKTPKHYLTP